MKQKLLNKLWLRVGMIVAIMTTALSGTAWAEEVLYYTLDGTTTGGDNGYATESSITQNEIGWKVTGNTTMSPWRIGGRSLSGVDRPVYSTTAMGSAISKVELTVGAASSITVNSLKLIVASDASFTNQIDEVSKTFAANSTITFTPTDGDDWATGAYYKFVFNVSVSGTSNKFVEFKNAKFYEETGTVLTESDLSLSPTSLSFDLYNDKSAKTITCTTSSTGAITVSASEYVTTSVSGNTITVTPVKATPSPQTITVNQAADATYAAGEKTFTVTISNSTPAIVYEKVTNANQLVAGNEYILVASTSTSSYAMGNMGNNLRSSVEVTVDDDAVSIQGEAIAVLTLGGISGAWTFLASDNDEYLAYSGSSNQLHSNSDASADASKWVITDDFQLESANVTGRYLQYNAGSPRFACYTGSQTDAYLYVKQGSPINTKVAPGFSFSADFAQANLGEAFTAPTFSNPNNVSVTFTSTDPTVATISDAGVVTLVGAGNTVISATSVADENYEAGIASYTLTVIDPNAPGSVNNPYTVAEAIAATPASGTSDNVYIHGIVSAFYSNGESILSDGNNYRYYISDDGTTSTQLVVYKGKGLNNETFSNEDDLLVGDEIVIYGKLNTYNQAPQVALGSYIVSLEREKQDPTIPSTPVSVAYGSTHTVTGIVAGEATLTSSNTAVATVEGLVITPVAVGTTTITVTTAENTYYNAGSGTFELTVTAPVGGTTAPTGSAGGTIFEETFADCTGTGEAGSFSGTGSDAIQSDNSGWTFVKASAANGCGKFGSSSADGSAKTPEITVVNGNTYTLTFKAAPWSTEANTQMNVSIEGGTITGISTDAMETQVWNEYEAMITATSTSVQITFAATAHRFFLDDVKVEASATPAPAITATLNANGYATFCSEYPLDFSDYETAGYSAWQITGVNGEEITFSQIKGSIKGGQGILLKGTAGETVELTSVNSSTTLSGNLLEGTLAPKYVAADEYYGLSGKTFVKVKAGTVPAGKALLPASALGSNVKAFTFVFEEDDATAIEMVNGQSSMVNGPIYNLAGQRISKMQKGINIVNGKKILK